jgi:hypothetical protein
MLSRLRLTLLLPLAALAACGGSSNIPAVGYIAPTSGDYVIVVAPGTASADILAGDLSIQGSSVTGAFSNVQGQLCIPAITVTGSLSTANVLNLSSNSFGGSTAGFTVQPLSDNNVGTETATGTVQVTGGTCTLASSSLQETYVPSFARTWTGTVTGPVNGTVTLIISQSTANGAGQFPATGVLSFTSANCTITGSNSIMLTGTVIGFNLQLASGNTTVSATNTASTLSLNLNLAAGGQGCTGGSYSGTLTG